MARIIRRDYVYDRIEVRIVRRKRRGKFVWCVDWFEHVRPYRENRPVERCTEERANQLHERYVEDCKRTIEGGLQ